MFLVHLTKPGHFDGDLCADINIITRLQSEHTTVVQCKGGKSWKKLIFPRGLISHKDENSLSVMLILLLKVSFVARWVSSILLLK